MAPVVEKNDVLLIPAYSSEQESKRITIEWSQSLQNRKADYYVLVAHNVTKGLGEEVPFYIASEYYSDATSVNPNHITKVGEKAEGGYKLHVNDRLQYGQSNKAGDQRFVVYHDKERKPYQHRFLKTAFASLAADKALLVARAFGQEQYATGATSTLEKFFGDYLHTF